MHAIVLLFFIIFFIVLLGLLIYITYKYVDNKILNNYNSLIESTGKKKIKKFSACPKGCKEGVCHNDDYCGIDNILQSNCCAFDFQCNNCIDSNGLLYKYPNNYNEAEEQAINLKNEKIKLQNQQIDARNQVIKKINEKIEENNK